LLQTRSTVAGLLELFERYGVHATWATVGMLFFRTREELLQGLPAARPEYGVHRMSAYREIQNLGWDEAEDCFHFGPSMIQAILDAPHQEIGSHTFSHYYCLEKGQTEQEFRADLKAAANAAARWGLKFRSLVFPRNQVRAEYLKAAADSGIDVYRGAGSHWFYRERPYAEEHWLRRAMRLLDTYFNISGHHTYALDGVPAGSPVDLPGSRFLRPVWPLMRPFERWRMKRICSGLDEAAEKGHAYHLWMHPEDLAQDRDRNLAALEIVLQRFAALRDRNRMRSLNMGEAAEIVLGPRVKAAALAAGRS
jgi:peptidoglycan/xylan/chitin deacetylase (PgdA/CDA1 family)